MSGNEDFSAWLMKILASRSGDQPGNNVHITINWNAPAVNRSPPDESPAGPVGPAAPIGPGPRKPRKRPDKLIAGDSGNTALHNAVLAANETLVQKLIDEKADVNAKNKAGSTPLHLAVNGRYQNIVKQLIEKGANLTATDNQGRNPFYALESEIKPAEKVSSSSPIPVLIRRRRQLVETGKPILRLATSESQVASYAQPQIGGYVSMLSTTNNAIISNATMLLELAARKLTGTNHATPTKVPLAKDRYMNRKLDTIDETLAAALTEYSGEAGSSSGRFSNPGY